MPGLIDERPRQAGPSERVLGIERERAFVALDRLRRSLPRQMALEELALQVERIRLGVLAATAAGGRHFRLDLGVLRGVRLGAEQRLAQFHDDGLRDVVLHGEDVVEFAVVAVRPQVGVLRGVDELRRDPHALARLAHAACQQVDDVELLRDIPDVDFLALEAPRRGARGHADAADPGQHVEEFLA